MLTVNAKATLNSVVSVVMAAGEERREENTGLSQLIMSSLYSAMLLQLLVFLNNRRDFYFLNSKFASECSE